MIWDIDGLDTSLYKPGDEVAANVIHTILQHCKQTTRERFEVPNADSAKEHGASDATTPGQHVPSTTGFVRVSTWDNRLTTDLREGSLHYITDTSAGLYIVDKGLEMIALNPSVHSELDNLVDDHTHAQYLDDELEGTIVGDMTIGTGGAVTMTDDTGSDNDDALQAAHVDLPHDEAHSENITARMIHDESVPASVFDISKLSWTENDHSVAGGSHFFFMFYSAPYATLGDLKFYPAYRLVTAGGAYNKRAFELET